MKRKLIFTITAILICLLTGCGKEEVLTAPVLGDMCRGYDGFRYLEETTLKMREGSLPLFVPKKPGRTSDEGSIQMAASSDGVFVRVRQISCPGGDILRPERCREWVLEECRAEHIVRAPGFQAGTAQLLENGGVRIPVSYYTIYGKKLKIHRTYYMQKLENGDILFLDVRVDSGSITRRTEGILQELEQFYPFRIDCNRQKVRQAAEAARRRRRPGCHVRIYRMGISRNTAECSVENMMGTIREQFPFLKIRNIKAIQMNKIQFMTLFAKEAGQNLYYRVCLIDWNRHLFILEIHKILI